MVLLTNESAALRRRAAFVLGQIGPDAETSAPLFQTLLDDPDSTVRVAAAQALWRIGSWSDEAFKILINAVVDDRTPAAAAHQRDFGSGRLRPRRRGSRAGLATIVRQPLDAARRVPTSRPALWQIADDLSGVESCLHEALQDENPESRVHMPRMPPSLGTAGKQFLEIVDRLQSDPNPTVRATALAVAKRLRGL